MERNKYIKFIILLAIFLFAFFIVENKNNATEIIVKNEVIKTIPSEYFFVGINWLDESTNGKYMYQEKNLDELAKTLKKININSIRYPAGIWVGNYFWDVPYKDVFEALAKPVNGNKPSPYLKYFTPADKLDFYRFIEFCRKNGFKTTLQLNTHKYLDKSTKEVYFLKDYKFDENNNKIWYTGVLNLERVKKAAKYAAQQVKWVKDNGYSDVVQYWELGNEEYVRSIPQQTYYTGDEYAKIAAIYIKEIKKVDPSAKILLTIFAVPNKPNSLEKPIYCNNAYLNKWDIDLLNNNELQKVKDYIFAVTAHVYTYSDSDPKNDITFYRKRIFNNNLLDVTERMLYSKDLISKFGYNNANIIMNEFNASDYNSNFSHSWLGALGNAKLIMSCANSPYCEHADMHNLLSFYNILNDVYKNNGFGIIHFASAYQSPFLLHPAANAIELLNENLKGNILKTDSTYDKVYAITSKEKNILNVILLNLEENRQITLNFRQFKDKISYLGNKSLGKDVPDVFSIIDEYDSSSNPSEVRQLNILENEYSVTSNSYNSYKLEVPKNTLIVLKFKDGLD